MKTTAIPFGVKGSNIVSVDQVESGQACGWVCPECKGKLVARKGEKNIWHFAHYSLSECESALETSIHLMAKDILSKAQTVRIPSIEVKHPQNKKLQKVSDDHPLLKPYEFSQSEPSKFTDKQRGIVQGTELVVCSNCGILTKNWSKLDTKTWTCTCKGCL